MADKYHIECHNAFEAGIYVDDGRIRVEGDDDVDYVDFVLLTDEPLPVLLDRWLNRKFNKRLREKMQEGMST